MQRVLSFTTLLLLAAATLDARVDHIEISSRAPYLGGRSFGLAGAYERVQGKVFFSLDASNPHNAGIIDLDRAPKNERGEVGFSSDFDLVQPADPARGNGVLFVNVPNRGGRFFIRDSEPDEWYLRQGFALAEVGWQFDVRPDPKLLRLDAPVARGIRGRVRADFVVAETRFDHPLGHLLAGAIGGIGYPVADLRDRDAILTERDSVAGVRRPINRSRWRFTDPTSIHLDSGFQPGKIYETIYTATDPAVVGTGLAAIRDFASWCKNDPKSLVHARYAYAMGISQTGRFLRHLIWQGFNADEAGHQVYDALLVYVAGAGRGSFNHRFAQPSRDAQPLSPAFYPTDLFPFSDLAQRDPVSGATAGLLDRAHAERVVPKIFYVNTAYEYWSRGGSLIHTTPDGSADAPVADDTRIYFVAGLGHVAGAFPPARAQNLWDASQQPVNANNIVWLRHGFVAALDAWTRLGVTPPGSQFPHVSDGTLVVPSALAVRRLHGVETPTAAYAPFKMNLGADWNRGITTEPPLVAGTYGAKVPQIGSDGNELAGVRVPELAVPLATYTGWNLRDPKVGFPDVRASFLGSAIPWPAAEVVERYHDRFEYLGRFADATLELIRDRFLVIDDFSTLFERAGKEWDFATRTVGGR